MVEQEVLDTVTLALVMQVEVVLSTPMKIDLDRTVNQAAVAAVVLL